MTLLDDETFTFDEADLLPPCEYSGHERVGDGPVTWAILLNPQCGCPSGFRLNCDPCFQYWSSAAFLKCGRCRKFCGSPRDNIVRVERIS